ncbi:MAG: ABC transporter permease [Gammaproteobacteria bacterium]|nr:ABC transporter permease [Gammaproteobacteria bacterium]
MNRLLLKWNVGLLALPLLLWIVLLIILPLSDLFISSFQEKVGVGVFEWGLGNYQAFLQEPFYWQTFIRTVLFSIIATMATLGVAFPVAYYIAKVARGRVKSMLFVLCLLPFWVSELVRNYGWMIILRESGLLNHFLMKLNLITQPIEFLYRDATVMMGLIYTSLLFMVVPLVVVLENLDESLLEASDDLGGGRLISLRRIIIPHAMPGIVSGCIMVFMLTLGNYLTATLLGGKESLWFTEHIYNQFMTRWNWELGSAMGFLLLVVSSALVWLGLRMTGQKLNKVMT